MGVYNIALMKPWMCAVFALIVATADLKVCTTSNTADLTVCTTRRRAGNPRHRSVEPDAVS
jgi:hypothetical protein